jgi:hypothetical protein
VFAVAALDRFIRRHGYHVKGQFLHIFEMFLIIKTIILKRF